MIAKKVAMLGLWGTGKTSLVSRFVNQVFDDKYHATLGVKMDTKEVSLSDQSIKMVLWDIAGSEDDFSVPMHFVTGSAGYILVLDGTRTESFENGLSLIKQVEKHLGPIPHVVVVNKNDLAWTMNKDEINSFFNDQLEKPLDWLSTSAKTGENVEMAFTLLAKQSI